VDTEKEHKNVMVLANAVLEFLFEQNCPHLKILRLFCFMVACCTRACSFNKLFVMKNKQE